MSDIKTLAMMRSDRDAMLNVLTEIVGEWSNAKRESFRLTVLAMGGSDIAACAIVGFFAAIVAERERAARKETT